MVAVNGVPDCVGGAAERTEGRKVRTAATHTTHEGRRPEYAVKGAREGSCGHPPSVTLLHDNGAGEVAGVVDKVFGHQKSLARLEKAAGVGAKLIRGASSGERDSI